MNHVKKTRSVHTLDARDISISAVADGPETVVSGSVAMPLRAGRSKPSGTQSPLPDRRRATQRVMIVRNQRQGAPSIHRTVMQNNRAGQQAIAATHPVITPSP